MKEALIAMAVYDTEENGRTPLTKKTLYSLHHTALFYGHKLFVIDNASCKETKELISDFVAHHRDTIVITNEKNIGTAKAINQAWRMRKPEQHLIKMDNDVEIDSLTWANQLVQAIERDPTIGIIGLKRKDLLEDPNKPEGHPYRSSLRMLPHVDGERWIVVEDVRHVMGTCQMYNWRLIDKIGGLYQMDGLYGFDDSLAAVRCSKAGFQNCFLPHIPIEHIDPGNTPYQKWKEQYAGEMMAKFNEVKYKLQTGEMPIYFPL